MNTYSTQQRSEHDRAWNQEAARRQRRPWPTSPESYDDNANTRDQFDENQPYENEDMSNYGNGGYYGNTYRQESYQHERNRPRIGYNSNSGRGGNESDHDRDIWPRAYEQRTYHEGNHRGKGPRGYQRSDKRIREDISDRLCDDAFVDASGIEVLVDHAEVTLKGTVDSREAKRIAEDISDSVSGVKNVENRLRVQPHLNQPDPEHGKAYGHRRNH